MKRIRNLGWPLIAVVALCCQLPTPRPGPSAPVVPSAKRWAQLVAATGCPEVPRYIKYRELDPQNRLRLLRTPTLQRGRIGRSIVLRRDVRYLYSVADDGTFLVGAKTRFASNGQCGHPNLTLGRPARISGELFYHEGLKRFVMDNDSGRYGFQTTRRRDQLEAARALLQLVGCFSPGGERIRPLTRWIQPRDGDRYRKMDRIRPVLRGAPPRFDAESWRRRFVSAMEEHYLKTAGEDSAQTSNLAISR